MKKLISFAVVMLTMCLVTSSGCNKPSGGWDFDQVAPTVQRATSLIAQVAFSDPRIANRKVKVCAATDAVVEFLILYNDPEATYDKLKDEVLKVIHNQPSENLIIQVVTEFILDSAWAHVRENYAEFVEQNETQTVILLTKSVAAGLQQACDRGIVTMADTGQAKINIETGPYLDTYFEKALWAAIDRQKIEKEKNQP